MEKATRIKRVKNQIIALILIICTFISIAPITSSVQGATSTKMSRMDFIRAVIDEMGIAVADNSNKAYKKAAIQTGIIDKDTFSSTKSSISYQDAAVIIAKAHEYLYGIGTKKVVVEKYPITVYRLRYYAEKDEKKLFFKSAKNGDLDKPYSQYALSDYLFFDSDGKVVSHTSYLSTFYRYNDDVMDKKKDYEFLFLGEYPNNGITAYYTYEYDINEIEYIKDEDILYILDKRITDSEKIAEKNKKWFAKAYAFGYIAGKSDGEFTKSRTFSPTKKAASSTLNKMIVRLTNEKERYTLTPDWQMCRISKKNRPIMEELYEYILDSFPNMYYDSAFNGMRSTRNTVILPKPYYSDFFYYLDVAPARFTNHVQGGGFQFAFPAELHNVLDQTDAMTYGSVYGYKSYYPYYNEYYIRRLNWTDEFIKEIEEYYTYALNIDYRTIDKDSEWKEVMSKYVFSDKLEEYIESCKKNKTIIECDKVAADYSSAYVGDTPLECKVYCHYRIVSDEPIKNKDKDNEDFLIPPCNRWSSSDREGKEARKHLLYYFNTEIGEWNDNIFIASGAMRKGEDCVKLVQTFITTDAMCNRTDRYTELVGNEEGIIKYFIK